MAPAYFSRANAYYVKGDFKQAKADFQKVLEFSTDPQLRQQAEDQLKALEAR